MENWQLLSCLGLALLVLEMLTPTMFFLNIAIACFITAVCSAFIDEWDILIYIWVGSSALLLLFLFPLLRRKGTKLETGLDKYIGQKAKVTETVSKTAGAISIYDERWNARIEHGPEIKAGETAVIYKHENLTMYIKKGE